MSDFILIIFIIAVSVGLYLLPTIVAYQRKHPNQNAIFLLNLLLGWTVLGWIIALIWSVMAIATSKDSQ